MPSKVDTKNTTEVVVLKKRVSALSDRVHLLESTIKRTQELIREDMSRLVEMVQQTSRK